MRPEIDPTVDYPFQVLFGREENAVLLMWLLNAVVTPVKPVTAVDFVLPHSGKTHVEDKLTIGDVKARDQGNRQFQVEMQWQVPWFFPKRALFYWSKFHPQQLREGESYITLRPTIFICFTKQILFPEVNDYHLIFQLLEKQHSLSFTDDLQIHLIELPRFHKTVEQLSTPLDQLLYFLRYGQDLDSEHLPPSLDVLEIRRALEVLTMFTQDERERELYEQRLKYQRDQLSLLQDAEERGLKKGIEKGIEQGIEKGIEQGLEKGIEKGIEQGLEKGMEKGLAKGTLVGKIQVFQELLKQPPTPEKDLSAMPEQELTILLDQLRKQALSNGG